MQLISDVKNLSPSVRGIIFKVFHANFKVNKNYFPLWYFL